jgi:hypothetical protein
MFCFLSDGKIWSAVASGIPRDTAFALDGLEIGAAAGPYRHRI